ncbi:MAG: hypothetical protein OXN81_05630 [Alphaproteobacteria bacterium]|nr:hypothetical protein [Alphaproteobacteria bacterium]
MLRAGGIVALATLPIVPVSGFLFAWAAFVGPSYGGPVALERISSTLVLMYIVFVACAAFVFWTTKQLFDASGYRAAHMAIVTLIVFLAFLPPLALLSHMWFSICAVDFGRQAGSRLWQVVGIVNLIGLALIAVGSLSMVFSATSRFSMDLILCAAFVLLIGWLCLGIGLIDGARRMARN